MFSPSLSHPSVCSHLLSILWELLIFFTFLLFSHYGFSITLFILVNFISVGTLIRKEASTYAWLDILNHLKFQTDHVIWSYMWKKIYQQGQEVNRSIREKWFQAGTSQWSIQKGGSCSDLVKRTPADQILISPENSLLSYFNLKFQWSLC